MRVRFGGVRGSTPTPAAENFRYGGNTSCVEVRSPQGEIIVFDCGTGRLRALGKQLLQEFGHRSVEAYSFLSHYHWDHIQGIPFFEPLYNPENSFHFHSFPGHRCSVQNALEDQLSAPYFPVNMTTMQAHRRFSNIENEKIGFKDLVLTTVPLNHPQGFIGFRMESGSNVLVYATDNEPGSPEHDRNIRKLAEGADILIYDAQYTPFEYANFKKGWGHSTWREAVNIAKEAQRYFSNVLAAWEGLDIDIMKGQHLNIPDPSERRTSSRERFQVPLTVQGRNKDGVPFSENTVLENLSIQGAYFLLENDPAPDGFLEVVSQTDNIADRPGCKPFKPIKSQLIRKYPGELADQVKHGIAVGFR